MRLFYLAWSPEHMSQTASAKLPVPNIRQTLSGELAASPLPNIRRQSSDLAALAQAFPLPWSAYVRLLSVKNPQYHHFLRSRPLTT